MTSRDVRPPPVAATPVVPAARRNLLSRLEGANDEPRTKEEWSSEPRQQSAVGRKQTPNTGQQQQQQQQQQPRGRSLDGQARALIDAQSVPERVAALKSLADISSSADLSVEELGAIRDTAGCVELLITRGANISHADKEHVTPMQASAELGLDEISELMLRYKLEQDEKLLRQIDVGDDA